MSTLQLRAGHVWVSMHDEVSMYGHIAAKKKHVWVCAHDKVGMSK